MYKEREENLVRKKTKNKKRTFLKENEEMEYSRISEVRYSFTVTLDYNDN